MVYMGWIIFMMVELRIFSKFPRRWSVRHAYHPRIEKFIISFLI